MNVRAHRGRWIGVGIAALTLVAATVVAGSLLQRTGTGSQSFESVTATRLEPVKGSQREVLQVLLRSASDQDAVSSYLRQEGFRIVHAGLRGRMLVVQADAAVIATALRARLYHWQAKGTDGTYVAADATPHLPAEIAARITAIYGLNRSMHGHPDNFPGPLQYEPVPLDATQLQTAYNVTPLLNAGTDGSGINVAIYAEGGFDKQRVRDFAAKYTPGHPVRVNVYAIDAEDNYRSPYPGTNACASPSDCAQEAVLDIDAVHAMAPGATIDVYELPPTPDVSSFGENLLSFMDHVEANNDRVVSISSGACDRPLSTPESPGFSTQELDGLDGVFMSDLNVSIFAASGDSGAKCVVGNDPNVTLTAAQFPASDPNVTGVGGTTLSLDNSNHIRAESAWDHHEDSLGHGASGGGVSSYFPRPCWQTGTGIPTGAKRMVPDVAADAAFESGMNIVGDSSGWWAWSGVPQLSTDIADGTSLSAPLWAGIAALFDQYAHDHRELPLGMANPLLYRLTATQSNHPLFDVTSGDQNTSDLAKPLPQPGWDASTGLGSMNAWTFVHDGASPTYTPPCPTPTPAPPLLGMPWDPSLHQQGFGTARPAIVNNGGDPTGYFTITWDTWGSGTATGHGTALWVPAGTPVAAGTTEPALFEAFDLGTCQGKSVYLHLAVWFPQHGESFDPTGVEASYTLCPP